MACMNGTFFRQRTTRQPFDAAQGVRQQRCCRQQ
jgi:hypothetical protein